MWESNCVSNKKLTLSLSDFYSPDYKVIIKIKVASKSVVIISNEAIFETST